MRAREFVTEASRATPKVRGRIHRDHLQAMPGAHRVAGTADRHYDLNRVMMAVAMADGETVPNLVDHNWSHKNNTAHPYTDVEANMLRHAYKAADVEWDDVLKPNPDNESLEPEDTNTQSIVKPFQGYAR